MTNLETHPSEANLKIVTAIGAVTINVEITMDTYRSASWIAPGTKEQPGTVMGHGILSWCYTIKSATDKDGRPFLNLTHYKDQIDMRVRIHLQKLLK